MKSTSANIAKSIASKNIDKTWLGANREFCNQVSFKIYQFFAHTFQKCIDYQKLKPLQKYQEFIKKEDGDVPGWVLVVLMTTGLVTAIWTIAAPKLSSILKNSLDSMNGIR